MRGLFLLNDLIESHGDSLWHERYVIISDRCKSDALRWTIICQSFAMRGWSMLHPPGMRLNGSASLSIRLLMAWIIRGFYRDLHGSKSLFFREPSLFRISFLFRQLTAEIRIEIHVWFYAFHLSTLQIQCVISALHMCNLVLYKNKTSYYIVHV